MSDAPSPFRIERVPPDRVEEAMEALLGAGPTAAKRFVAQAAKSGVSLERIWCLSDARDRYRLAVLAVAATGRTVMLLASRTRDDAQTASLAEVIRTASESCSEIGDIAQTLLEPERRREIDAFVKGGFTRLATLEYQERALPRTGLPEVPPPPAGWTIEPVGSEAVLGGDDLALLGDSARAEIERVLEASYRDTLDCPGLAGMRRTSDVLAGHFGQGRRLRHWMVARRSGEAGGVCLLNGSPDGQTAELVYFGVAPEARGGGLSTPLLAAGIRACAASGCKSVHLAVDERNEPAKRLYSRLGFHTVSSRVALVRRTRVASRDE